MSRLRHIKCLLILLLIFIQGCVAAIPVASTVAGKGFEYASDGTVFDVMSCPLELCMEYGRLVLRDMKIKHSEKKEETFWMLQGTIPGREIVVKFYPLTENLTRVAAKVFLSSNKMVHDKYISEEILQQMNRILAK